jgi:TetR/AcrR family transcriptional regulator
MAREAVKPKKTVKRPARASGAARDESRDYRQEVLDAAVQEFADKGYSGARVDTIAARAKANKQLIYYYFGNKLGLYEAVLDTMIGHTAEQLDVHGEHEHVSEAVQTHIDNLLNGSNEWIRFWLWEALENTTTRRRRNTARAKAWARWVDEFARAQERGEIAKKYDPKMLALAMNSIIVMPYMTPAVGRLIAGVEPGSEVFLKQQLTLLADLLESLAD